MIVVVVLALLALLLLTGSVTLAVTGAAAPGGQREREAGHDGPRDGGAGDPGGRSGLRWLPARH